MTDSNNIGRAPVAKLDEASVPETPPQFRARRADPPPTAPAPPPRHRPTWSARGPVIKKVV